MKVIVRKDDETEADFEVADDSTVQGLKELILENCFGENVVEQRLEFNGQVLENDKLLSSYGIENNSIVLLKENATECKENFEEELANE